MCTRARCTEITPEETENPMGGYGKSISQGTCVCVCVCFSW